MASYGLRAQKPIGSSAWIETERDNVRQLVDQEMEDVVYPAQNELQWLNEHMDDIFGRSQFNVTEIFKTPGRLRGKTPRTARRQQPNTPQTARAPLTDIFSSGRNVRNSPAPQNRFNQAIAKLALAGERAKSASPAPALPQTQPSQSQEPTQQTQNTNPDSAYGSFPSSQPIPDRMDMEYEDPARQETHTSKDPATQHEEPPKANVNENMNKSTDEHDENIHGLGNHVGQSAKETATVSDPQASQPTERRTTEDSFHSARELASKEQMTEPEIVRYPSIRSLTVPAQDARPKSFHAEHEPAPVERPTASKPADTSVLEPNLDDDVGSPSDGSTPEQRPLVRKSSLTFASLPAREPLPTKKSIGGARLSRTSHVDLSKLNNGQSSYFAKQGSGSKPLDAERGQDENSEHTSKLHNKSSTQLLQEKISMLGKSQPSQPSRTKSITAAPLSTLSVSYPEIPLPKPDSVTDKTQKAPQFDPSPAKDTTAVPPKSPMRAPFPQQLAGEATIEPPERYTREGSVAPGIQHSGSQRPASPVRPASPLRQASPVRVASPVRTASQLRPPSPMRGMSQIRPSSPARNTSPTHVASPTRHASPVRAASPERRSPGPKMEHGNFFHAKSNSTTVAASPKQDTLTKSNSVRSLRQESPIPSSPKRYEGPLSASKMRLQSIMKSAKGLFTSSAGISAAAKVETLSPTATRVQQPRLYPDIDRQQTVSPTPQLQEGRRTRSSTEREAKQKEEMQRMDEQLNKAREQERQKAALFKRSQEDLEKQQMPPPKAPATKPSPKKQPSREPEPIQKNDRRPVRPTRETQKQKPQPVNIRVGTLSSQRIPLNTTIPSTQEPSHQISKKPSTSSLQTSGSVNSYKSTSSAQSTRSKAAQATMASEKRQEEEQAEKQAELQRKQRLRQEAERKRAAQLEETRRQEQAAQAEAEKRERERVAIDDAKRLAHKQAIEKRRLENQKKLEQQRSQQDLKSTQRELGTSRPPSRLGSMHAPNRPINYSTGPKPVKRPVETDAGRPAGKRVDSVHQADGKRRKTNEEAEPPVRPTLAPPIRQSNVRKEILAKQYGGGMVKNSLGGHHAAGQQRPMHPLEMSKFASGKIPFAEPSTAKTPGPGPSRPLPPPRASPVYPNGDSIKLPEIPTDSEDEDDSDAEPAVVPDWARPENLQELLVAQEGEEPENVFGPAPPLHMEEIFKDSKHRHRFRDRTSSANWNGPDGLTQAEIEYDNAARLRMKQNGGWMFGL